MLSEKSFVMVFEHFISTLIFKDPLEKTITLLQLNKEEKNSLSQHDSEALLVLEEFLLPACWRTWSV